VFVIRPDQALGISRVEKDPEKLLRVYHQGRRQMEARAGALMDWLAGKA
jgi:predicted patatin/cPLA2 family phospholipase